MTETTPSQPRSHNATARARTTPATQRRRARPAAASRILVTGVSIAATIGLATAMAEPPPPPSSPPASVAADDQQQLLPAPPVVTPTDQAPVTASRAS